MSDYTELKSLAELAGSGEWGYSGSYVCPVRRDGETTYVEAWRMVADCYQMENTKFIAAANPAVVLALIAENERLTSDSESLRKVLKRIKFRCESFDAQGTGMQRDSVGVMLHIASRALAGGAE